jgi:glycosyltransferase involved in cell wall biosynthesis
VIFTEHGRDHPDHPRPKRMLTNRVMLERRDKVIAVGGAVREALIHNEGFPAERVGVIYNGVDLERFRNRVHRRESIRQELGLDPADLVILQVARLNYLKDHLTAVRAMERVVAQSPRARLLLIGDGEERERIEQEIARRRVSDNVRLLGQRVDVSRLLPAADLFLLTSISEGIPLTLIEAMAAGLPVVSTRVGGVGEVVEDGETGLLVPAGHDKGIAEALARLAGDLAGRQAMGARGRLRADRLFAERSMHDQYRRLYRETLPVQEAPI